MNTDLVTIQFPRAWLGPATGLTVHTINGAQVLDMIAFDLVEGQPCLAWSSAVAVEEKGAEGGPPR